MINHKPLKEAAPLKRLLFRPEQHSKWLRRLRRMALLRFALNAANVLQQTSAPPLCNSCFCFQNSDMRMRRFSHAAAQQSLSLRHGSNDVAFTLLRVGER
ncbi:hypothetical protein D3C77_156410 [compost metagenome]